MNWTSGEIQVPAAAVAVAEPLMICGVEDADRLSRTT
jgi:hypothetical protein